jgi:hypothetical protein
VEFSSNLRFACCTKLASATVLKNATRLMSTWISWMKFEGRCKLDTSAIVAWDMEI